MDGSHRLTALWIIRCYRTVSDTAAMILEAIPPSDLLAQGRLKVVSRLKSDEVPVTTTMI